MRYCVLMPSDAQALPPKTPGEALRQLRESKGLSVREAAESLSWSPSKLSRIETSSSGIKSDDLTRILNFYRAPDGVRSDIGALARHRPAKRPRRRGSSVPDAYARYADLEAQAIHIQMFCPVVVPGLLQTPEYAAAVIASTPAQEEGFAKSRMDTRLLRQGIFARPTPLRMSVVIDEAVLHRPIGGDAVMRRQMLRLQEMNDRSEITIRILPFSVGAHPALTGQFAILHFPPDLRIPTHVFCDGLTGGVLRNDASDIERYLVTFTALNDLTLTEERSAEIFAATAKGDRGL